MFEEAKGKAVYLSGPMSGREDLNRAAFAEAERACRAAGALRVFNPAAGSSGDGGKGHAAWMLEDLHELTANDGGRPSYDLVLLLPGWEGSEGARAERACAAACGIETAEVGDDAR